MLREGWNFHDDIAVPLEHDSNILYGWPHPEPKGKIYSADMIEAGHFAEAMMLLLRVKADYAARDDIDSFVKRCSAYAGLRASEIEKEAADNLYIEFKRIFSALS